jgi:AAA domain
MTGFKLSRFKYVADSLPQCVALTWKEFCASMASPEVRADKDGPLFSPATFDPKTRANGNVVELSMLGLDCDHGCTFDGDLPRWRKHGYTFAAYTTHSHKRVTDSNKKGEERFRIALPLAAPIPAVYHPALWQWAFHVSGEKLDPSAKDLARMFYTPAKFSEDAEYRHEIHDGALLDWRELPPLKYVVTAFENEMAKLLGATDRRNDQLFKSTAALGELIAGECLDEDRVIKSLTEAAEKIGLDVDKNCGPKGIASTIQSGLRTGRKKPRRPDFDGKPKAKLPEEPPDFLGWPPETEAWTQPAKDDATPVDFGSGFYSSLRELHAKETVPADDLMIGVRRRQVTIFASVTSVGKTTIMLNHALAAAGGQRWSPLLPEKPDRPLKIVFIDAESTDDELKKDTQTMLRTIGNKELALDNFIPIVDATLDGEALNLSTRKHFEHVKRFLQYHQPDIAIFDTITALFTLFSENDNAEVIRKVIRPLKELAVAGNCAIWASHHIGKSGESDDAADTIREVLEQDATKSWDDVVWELAQAREVKR